MVTSTYRCWTQAKVVQIAADQHDAVQRLSAELAASKEASGRLLTELHTAQVRRDQATRTA